MRPSLEFVLAVGLGSLSASPRSLPPQTAFHRAQGRKMYELPLTTNRAPNGNVHDGGFGTARSTVTRDGLRSALP